MLTVSTSHAIEADGHNVMGLKRLIWSRSCGDRLWSLNTDEGLRFGQESRCALTVVMAMAKPPQRGNTTGDDIMVIIIISCIILFMGFEIRVKGIRSDPNPPVLPIHLQRLSGNETGISLRTVIAV